MAVVSPRLLLFFCLSSWIVIWRAPSGDAWGKEGHIMVCKIAELYLTEKTAEEVRDLLPETAGGDLSTVCPWADEVRFRYRWSSPLHFVNTPGVCNYKYSRDCHNPHGEKGMCAVGAINNYTEQLLDTKDPSNHCEQAKKPPLSSILLALTLIALQLFFLMTTDNLTESLMFLAHFVGDIHQPLHAGFAADLGGNTIVVHWYKRKSNLHHVEYLK